MFAKRLDAQSHNCLRIGDSPIFSITRHSRSQRGRPGSGLWGLGTGDSGLGVRGWGFGAGSSGLGIRGWGLGAGDWEFMGLPWKKGTGSEPAAFLSDSHAISGSEPVPIFHSPLTTHHSSLTTRHSSLITPHSPLITPPRNAVRGRSSPPPLPTTHYPLTSSAEACIAGSCRWPFWARRRRIPPSAGTCAARWSS